MIQAVPIDLSEANAFVSEHHRHHKPVWRDKFRIGTSINGKLVGVVQVGRPVSRMLDDGKTLEIVRLCTTGERNVCSFLLSRSVRIAKDLGYKRIITYILESESGVSLIASGFTQTVTTSGGSWDRPSRHRESINPTCPKKRYERIL